MKTTKITPKKAQEWLQRNVNNRPVRQRLVNDYAAAMTAGAWKVNGDSIRFNCNGDMVDGQHRLLACIKSGVTFESYVVDGIQVDAFDTIDQGFKRVVSDLFARRGYKHYVMLASGVRWIWRYEGSMTIQGAMREDLANDIIERHSGIHTAVQIASEHSRSGLIQPGLFAFLLYWTGQKDVSRAEKFWLSVVDGDSLEKGTPAYLLNRRLVQNLGSVSKLGSTVVAALSVKAWNAHVSKKPSEAKILKWAEAEAFPTILY